MRITFLTPADNFTGGTRVIATYAQRLQALGHRVTVVSNAPDRPGWRQRWHALWTERRFARGGQTGAPALPSDAGHLSRSGVPHHVLERPRAITARDVPDADVVMATWWETAVWMHALPLSKGRRAHLIQGHEVWTGGDVRDRVHAALRLPNRKITVSHALARELQDAVGALDLTVVPNAVDLAQFDAPRRERGEPPTVGFIYARAPIKGSDVCARACELARRSLPALRVLAFGVDRPTADWPLPEGTEFIHMPDPSTIPGLYARCDAWLFGSRVDSFGLPILEAMACRTPVVGVPVGAAPELLAQGAGVLLPDAEAESMAQALVALLAGPAPRWRQMAEAAHARAHRYSWDEATTRLLAALEADRDAGPGGRGLASTSPDGLAAVCT